MCNLPWLKDETLAFLKSKNLEVINSFGERNYFFNIKNNNELDGIFLHAREIIERVNDGTLDIGISGLDILKELPDVYSKNVKIFKKLNFGFADLVVAVPKDWLDVQNMADLEEVSFEFREKYGRRMRVATKYPNLTESFFLSKGVSQFRVVPSLGATESYPFTGSSELITDITSTGSTLKANNLRIINDGIILKSSACIFVSIEFNRFAEYYRNAPDLNHNAQRDDRRALAPGVVKLYMNIGGIDGFDFNTIKEFIAENAEINTADITWTDLKNTFSLIEVKNEAVDKIMETIHGAQYRGRTVRVESRGNRDAGIPRTRFRGEGRKGGGGGYNKGREGGFDRKKSFGDRDGGFKKGKKKGNR